MKIDNLQLFIFCLRDSGEQSSYDVVGSVYDDVDYVVGNDANDGGGVADDVLYSWWRCFWWVGNDDDDNDDDDDDDDDEEEEDDDDEDEGVDTVDDDGYTRQCNKRTTYIWV